ncbi:DUF5952 family protein [Chitinophaga japonensis]|uniref:Uncharacterized protein n=1 Tax=Chitinophaga japonensis TaxID=104662 RepID=A0A562STA1_CHIJA|nr:DUF5952 family protein [Chitinophaga japonensis]TWI84519.1 hypothetical protein LX66_4889 [Chitinophaga japonensis]
MKQYTVTINCEFLNEAGILVGHTLKTIVHTLPRVADKYMFMANQHFKPIVIRIMSIVDPETDLQVLICNGEEVDDVDDITEVIDHSAFVVD